MIAKRFFFACAGLLCLADSGPVGHANLRDDAAVREADG